MPGALQHVAELLLESEVEAFVCLSSGHRRLLEFLGKTPLLDLGMRLGEASGAAVAVSILRSALVTHNGMATFEEAAVSRETQ